MVDLSNIKTDELEAELARREAEAHPPERTTNPNWANLEWMVDDYLKFCANLEEFYEDNDYEHYIAECAIKALYPGFYKWYNNRYK